MSSHPPVQRRAELARYLERARLDLEAVHHLADQMPEFVARFWGFVAKTLVTPEQG